MCHELVGFLYKHSDEYHILLLSPGWHTLQHTKICTLSSVGGKEGGGDGPLGTTPSSFIMAGK
jgi:hypothetical protein